VKNIKSKVNMKIIVIILSIVFVGIALFSSTYALFYSEDVAGNESSYSTGLLSIVAASKSDVISLNNALPMTDTEGLESAPYVFTIKNVGNLDYKFNIMLLSTDDSTIEPAFIKLQVDDGEVTTLTELPTGGVIKENIVLKARESIDISIRIWLSIDTTNDQLGKTFNSKIVTEGEAIYTENDYDISFGETGLLSTIYNLYNPNDTAVVNGVAYALDTNNKLMKDVGGNVRYYGANPNNYIYFNCSDYANPSSATCEKWRIIGIVDGKVKIMRNESIGNYSWDTSASTINNGYGINEWSQSDAMKLLNTGYETNQDLDSSGNSITVNNSLYWIGAQGTSGKCYNGRSNATIDCNMVSKGLKNDETRNLISEHNWNLGGGTDNVIYVDTAYSTERSGLVNKNPADGVTRTTTWLGRIALPYPSDYGYAADLSICKKTLDSYNDSLCTENNWMATVVGSTYARTLSIVSSKNSYIWAANLSKAIGIGGTVNADAGIIPTLYLKSDIIINGGNGSSEQPYLIGNYENYNAKFFDGINDYVDAGYGNHDFGKSLTIGARFNADAIRSSNGFMISNVEGAGFGLYVSLANRAYILVYSSSASAYKNVYTTTTIEPGKWYNLVATYDGSYLRLYLNGEADGTPLAFTEALKVSTADVVLGGNALGNYANTEFFDGMISHAFVSSDVLTAEQIAENFSTDFNYTENANTLIYYDFTE